MKLYVGAFDQVPNVAMPVGQADLEQFPPLCVVGQSGILI